MITLTHQERDKFASYLEQSAASGRGIIEEMEKLGSIPPTLIKNLKMETVAEELVAARLRAIEEQTI